MRKLRFAGFVALVALLQLVGVEATSADHAPPGLEVTDVVRGTVSEGFRTNVGGIRVRTKEPVDLVTVQATFRSGGGSAGWHHHPGPVFVVIKSGELTAWNEHCEERTYRPGEAFVEQGPKHSMLVKNVSDIEDAVIYATFIVPVGAQPLSVPDEHRCDIDE